MSSHIRFNDSDDEFEQSNSEDELPEREQKLLKKFKHKDPQSSDSEEEVFGITVTSSEEEDGDDSDIALSDVEGQDDEEDDDGIPDAKAWGKNKKQYYSTDYVDPDFDGYQGGDIMQAELEEQEALNLQNDLAKTLDDDDFALDFAPQAVEEKETAEEDVGNDVIKTDVSKLSKRQKLQLLMKESPEFFGLIEDYKNRMASVIEDILPVIKLYKEGKVKNSDAMEFLNKYHQIILNYTTNIQMYLLLKANKVPLKTHPVIKRLYQYRQLLSQMDPIFEDIIKVQLKTLISHVSKTIAEEQPKNKGKLKLLQQKLAETSLKRKRNDNEIEPKPKSILKVKDSKEKKSVAFNESNLITAANNSEDESSTNEGEINQMDEFKNNEDDSENPKEVNAEDSKRPITYQIAKNKGLMPKRKKEQRNPRVKHRNKFRKAKIRRKGAVREVRTEMKRYSGEISGIKASVSKSIKIKS